MTPFGHIIPASFWTSDEVVRMSRFVDDHQSVIQGLLILIVLSVIPVSWKLASHRFEKGHQRLLWIVVAVMLLLIPIVFYWQSH